MITINELDYVSSWANKVPYPGTDYAEEALENLAIAVANFKKYYSNKKYGLILSNGEQISFEILEKNLCHLLGIDYKNLSGDYFKYYRYDVLKLDYEFVPKSFDLLNAIINNSAAVIKYDYDKGERNGKAINYYRVMIKCAIFEKLSDFSRFNFGVINFDKDKYIELTNSNFSSGTEKYLYVQSNEPSAPYFMMGILHDNSYERDNINSVDEQDSDVQLNQVNNKFVPNTLIAPVNVKDFFNEQEVVIPTQILVNSGEKMDKIEALNSEKLALINQYEAIINKYGVPNGLNIYGDYKAMLGSDSKRKVLIRENVQR